MKQYEIICPNCGHKILITISESNPDYIGVTFFDIFDGSETTQLASEYGYELGEEGGKNNGK